MDCGYPPEMETWGEMDNFDRGMWFLFEVVCWVVEGTAKIVTSPIWVLGYVANKRGGRTK